MHTGNSNQRIAIIGSSSFLANYFIKHYSGDSMVDLYLFGRLPDNVMLPQVHHLEYRLPHHPINYEVLMTMDVIIYCAGLGVQSNQAKQTQLLYQVNLNEPINILTYLNEHEYKGVWVSFGSYFEIGSYQDDSLYLKEEEIIYSHYPVPNDYCISKRLLSRFVESSTFSFRYYHCLLTTIFGRGEQSHRLLPYLLDRLYKNEPVKLSSGTQVRQYIHASTAVKMIIDLIHQQAPSGCYSIGTGVSMTVKNLVEQIAEVLDKSHLLDFGQVQRVDQSMEVLQVDVSKVLQWVSTPKELSIKEIIEDYNM
jgi:nucleoside-diphosphate-sugar epimerase